MDEFMCYVYGYQDVDDGDGHPLPNVDIFFKKRDEAARSGGGGGAAATADSM